MQRIFESNFDEDLVNFSKISKWQKLDLNVDVTSSKLEIEKYQLVDPSEKLLEDTLSESNQVFDSMSQHDEVNDVSSEFRIE